MRAYIVEGSEIIRSKLVLLLAEIEGVELVGQTGSAGAAKGNILRLQPDMALVDIKLPDGDGLDILELIHAHGLRTRSIVMTFDPYLQYWKRAMELGAVHFIDKAKEFGNIRLILEQMVAEHRATVAA